LEDVAKLLIKACVIVDCKLPVNTEDAPVATMLWDYICRYHSTHTVKSFILAFEMNVAGLLGDKRIEHFGCFSNQYVSEVLNAFDLKRRDAVKQAMKTTTEDHKPVDENDKPKPETYEAIYNDHIEQVKKGIVTAADLLGATMFDWLCKSGRLTDDMIPTDLHDKWKLKARQVVFDRMQIGEGKWKRLKETKSNEYQRIREHIIAEQKRMCYLWHLKSIK
jgi:hypothetical protein